MASVTLWTRNPEAVWAVNGLTRHRGRHGRPEIGTTRRINGHVLVVSKPNRPYGRSIFKKRYGATTHLADRVVLIWRDGRYLGAQAMWLCGGITESFLLTEEQEYTLCVQCAIRAGTVKIEIQFNPPT